MCAPSVSKAQPAGKKGMRMHRSSQCLCSWNQLFNIVGSSYLGVYTFVENFYSRSTPGFTCPSFPCICDLFLRQFAFASTWSEPPLASGARNCCILIDHNGSCKSMPQKSLCNRYYAHVYSREVTSVFDFPRLQLRNV